MQRDTNITDHALEIYDDEFVLETEDNLWWIQGRKFIIRRYLDSLMEQSERQIVDIGCGSGGSLDVLAEYGTVVGVEISPKLSNIAKKRQIGEIICGDFFELDIRSTSGLFTLFDVLEHIEDDHKFVEKISRTNDKSHHLLVSVPAMPILYSQHDELLHHHRRYTHVMLRDLLESNGYEVVSMSYFMSFLLPLIIVSRLSERLMLFFGKRKENVTLGQVPRWLNSTFSSILRFEAFLSKWISFPLGLWLFALAKYTDEENT